MYRIVSYLFIHLFIYSLMSYKQNLLDYVYKKSDR